MHPIEQIIALLLADGPVSAIVGGRIFADNPPQDTVKPSIEIYNISDEQFNAIDLCTPTAGVMTIQINHLTATRKSCVDLAAKTRRAILHHTSTDSAYQIQDVNLAGGGRWDAIRPTDGSDSYTYESQNDYYVSYRFEV